MPGPALAHVASAEGIICIEKIAGHHPEPLDYGNIPGCTYSNPEIASVGITEKVAKEKGESPAAKSAVTQTPATTDGAKPKAPAIPKVEAEAVDEPVKRTAKKNAEPAPKKEFADVLSKWTTDDEWSCLAMVIQYV